MNVIVIAVVIAGLVCFMLAAFGEPESRQRTNWATLGLVLTVGASIVIPFT